MDIRQLQQLDQFVAFFDLISNPEKYQKLIAEAKEASADFTRVVKEQRDIQDIESFRARVLEQVTAREREVDVKEEDLKRRTKEFSEYMEDHWKRLQEKERDLNELLHKVRASADDMVKVEDARKLMEAEKKELDEYKAELDKRTAAVKQREDAMAAFLKGTL